MSILAASWKLKLLKAAVAYANSRLHAVKAEVLLLARSEYTKGSGCFLRIMPRAELTVEELSKRRACSVCGKKGGYNSKTCTQLFPELKKAKKQDMPKRESRYAQRAGLRESTRRK
ncbi:hypothetical protein Tco_1549112 [Tanacetum coccineum]